jgi:hypothetical protein
MTWLNKKKETQRHSWVSFFFFLIIYLYIYIFVYSYIVNKTTEKKTKQNCRLFFIRGPILRETTNGHSLNGFLFLSP